VEELCTYTNKTVCLSHFAMIIIITTSQQRWSYT